MVSLFAIHHFLWTGLQDASTFRDELEDDDIVEVQVDSSSDISSKALLSKVQI